MVENTKQFIKEKCYNVLISKTARHAYYRVLFKPIYDLKHCTFMTSSCK